MDELLTPIIINDSEQVVESENSAIESRFEYTVVFPGTEEINETNMGHMLQEAFRHKVIDSLDTSTSVTLVCAGKWDYPTQGEGKHRTDRYELPGRTRGLTFWAKLRFTN